MTNPEIVIADSSGLISFLLPDDSNYHKAINAKSGLLKTQGLILILSEVIAETMNILGKKFGHSVAVAAYRLFVKVELFSIIESDSEIRDRAVEKYQDLSQSISYIDCLVMVCADQFETKYIFGFDEVFGKNGYKLPR